MKQLISLFNPLTRDHHWSSNENWRRDFVLKVRIQLTKLLIFVWKTITMNFGERHMVRASTRIHFETPSWRVLDESRLESRQGTLDPAGRGLWHANRSRGGGEREEGDGAHLSYSYAGELASPCRSRRRLGQRPGRMRQPLKLPLLMHAPASLTQEEQQKEQTGEKKGGTEQTKPVRAHCQAILCLCQIGVWDCVLEIRQLLVNQRWRYFTEPGVLEGQLLRVPIFWLWLWNTR